MISVEEDAGELFFDNLIEPWGHTTIQIVFFDIRFFKEITEPLEKITLTVQDKSETIAAAPKH